MTVSTNFLTSSHVRMGVVSNDHNPERARRQEPLFSFRQLVESLCLILRQNAKAGKTELIRQVSSNRSNSLVTIDYFESGILCFCKVEWRNRDVKNQGFD